MSFTPGAAACLASLVVSGLAVRSAPAQPQPDAPPRVLTLAQSLEVALENNRTALASRLSVEIAEAQFRPAKSVDWPQIGPARALEAP